VDIDIPLGEVTAVKVDQFRGNLFPFQLFDRPDRGILPDDEDQRACLVEVLE